MNLRLCALLLSGALLSACGGTEPPGATEHASAPAAEYERGPHRGRMLRDGNFALEVTVYETNVEPHYRLYAYLDDRPLPPGEVQARIRIKRLDGEQTDFQFVPEQDHLKGSATLAEPHSFDVQVQATHAGKRSSWQFASYEGRVSIPAKVAEAAGIKTEVAGPGVIKDNISLMGVIVQDANRHAQVKARFPGVVRAVNVRQGDRVRRGQTLVVVEGNDSMRTYPVSAPFDGVVLVRQASVGEVTGSDALMEIADLSRVWVELHAIGKDAARLEPGQAVSIRAATTDATVQARIDSLLPLATVGQSVVARVSIPNQDGSWRPGMVVSAEVSVASTQAQLTVLESGLQRFRDFTVVFAQVGDTYEVRMLELGARDGERVEVLGGLKPGTRYVSQQSFLIKADIEKSGASHDH
ncbi:efflux RND transporter periplasmic adaptor subunit [Pseudoxanthomonas spadix]|uniref:efflux RND transporter periplasmic adaptor subunit n=1 Tax=Pseudoxanthomonas spadix TaxID=415229 RepID=UPI000EFF6EA3|nr:efflux RND transporter periplasmic adaptor subunit [Pseudoxanthomonas spadix]MBP3975614.1 efflux RND transporter periplasmic adaptor subunit [Pseudoxanthomonas spadix]RMW92661.1 HlyD family efflux transporter periplasmic adaptor subunit [Pseudoxanthomonas spadix]